MIKSVPALMKTVHWQERKRRRYKKWVTRGVRKRCIEKCILYKTYLNTCKAASENLQTINQYCTIRNKLCKTAPFNKWVQNFVENVCKTKLVISDVANGKAVMSA